MCRPGLPPTTISSPKPATTSAAARPPAWPHDLALSAATSTPARRLLPDLQSLTITNVIDEGLHEFLQEIQTSLDKIGEEVVQTTMFYPAESSTEEQQQQQQQQ